MAPIESGVCRFCACTEAEPCDVPPYGDGDICCWLQGTHNTVCTAPACIVQWDRQRKAARAFRPRRLTPAEVHDAIMGRGKRRKKGRAA